MYLHRKLSRFIGNMALGILFILSGFPLFAQTNLYSGGTGNVGSITWYTLPARTGPTGTPGSNTILHIGNGHTVTVPSGTTATYAGIVVHDQGASGTFVIGNATNATSNITVTGNITINSNGAFRTAGGTGASHNFSFRGAIENNNIFNLESTAAPSTATFLNTTTVALTGSGTFQFRNLTVSGGNDVEIEANTRINGVLDFASDVLLRLGATSNLTITQTSSIINAGSSRYIQVAGTGSGGSQLIRMTNATTTIPNSWRMVYPIGTAEGGYTPLDMTNATLTTNPTANSTLAVTILYNQSVPGQLRRQFRLTVAGNAANTTFHSASFTYNEPTDVSTGDVLSSYSLIRYTNNANITSIIAGTAPGSNSFTAPAAGSPQSLGNGTSYFSIGSSAVWYTYQDGIWSDWEVWTQDPSGTTLQNPLTQIPLPGDQVVILNGYTVSANIPDIVLSSTTIEGGGTLDVTTTVGHNLGAIDGSGLLRVNGITLPAGVYTNFVAAGSGGTIEYYNTSGVLPAGQTTYNHLLLTNNGNGNTIFTSVNNLTINGNISVLQTGGAGTVTWQVNNNLATQRTMTISGNLLVSSGGRIRAGTGNPANAHILNLYGDLTNEGSIRFFDDTFAGFSDANYTSGAVFSAAPRGSAVNVTFMGLGTQNVTCNSQTDFYRLIVNKGSGQLATLTINSSGINNFRLFAPNNQDLSGTAPNLISDNSLSIVNGTLQLTGYIHIPSLVVNGGGGIGGGWPIPQSGALWVNSPNVSIQATNTTDTGDNGRQIYVFGLLRLTEGTINSGYSRGLLGGGSGVFIIEGGTLNTWQIRTTYLGSNNRFAYIQRGGEVNVGTAGTNGAQVNTYPRFALPYTECTFEMTGGVLNIGNPMNSGTSVNGGMLIWAAESNVNVTGGTVNIILPGSAINFNICSTAPLYNLNVTKTGAGSSAAILNPISFNDNTGYTRAATPLVVLNNLTLATGNLPTFNCNSNNLTVGGNFDVQASTTYTSGTNVLTFNGTSNQTWTHNGTINALRDIVVNKGGTLQLAGANNFPNIVGLTLSAGTLNDGGKTLTVTSTLSNSATHTGTGAIIANGVTAIGGTDGVFGNLSISTNGTVSTSGRQTVSGTLRLINASSSLFIGSNNLTVLGNIHSDAGTGVAFSTTKRIVTAGMRNDGGLTRQGTAGSVLFPVGTSVSAYSPASIAITASGHGLLTMRPVSIRHPNAVPAAQALNYYWRVSSTGYSGVTGVSHNAYTYGSTGLLAGTLTAYKPARYDQTTFTWQVGTTYTATGLTVIPNFNFGTWIDGEYTAGNITPGVLLVFYTRTSGAWNSNLTWSNSPCSGPNNCGGAVAPGTYPCPTCPVVIGDDNNNHTVTIDANGRNCGSLQITTGSAVDCSTFTSLNFGANNGDEITGRGLIRIASNVFPNGDFSNFIGPNGGTVEWYGGTKTIPASGLPPENLNLSSYYNLIVNPNNGVTITLPPTNLEIYNTMTKTGSGTVTTNTGAARTIAVHGGFNIENGIFTTASAFTTDFTLHSGLNISSGASFQPANATSRVHTITTSGSITNNGTLSLRNGGHLINLVFTGPTDANFTGTNPGASTILNTITLNKGTSQEPKLTIDFQGTVNAPATNWLFLQNGNVIFNKPGTTFSLSTALAAYSIPSTSRLTVQSGVVNIVGDVNDNAGDLWLAGTLEVAGGEVNVNPASNNRNTHNDIEYASAGTPTILVSSGSLYVNGMIRRPLTTLSGALVYQQSGGTVTVGGRNATVQNQRGVFEIENNSGSNFTMTGGVLTIQRSGGVAAAYADIHLNPASSHVNTSGLIEIGIDAGAVTTPLSINIVPPVGNLTLVGNSNVQNVNIRSSPLSTAGTLIINSNTTLITNGLNVNIGGDLTIDGTYNGSISGGNTTTFDGTGSQLAKLSASSSFQNITIAKPAGTVTLSGVSPTINNLNILNGVLDVANLGLTVNGDIVNNSQQIGAGEIIMSGASYIQYITSSNGSFTNLRIAGSGSAKNVKLTGNLSMEGELSFASDNRYFSIGSSLLTFGTNGITTGANSLRFIRTNGASSDLGVVKNFALGSASFVYEVGVLNYYSPVSFSLNVTTPGTLNVVPVNQRHPTANLGSPEQILNFYWIVTRGSTLNYSATGSHTYAFPSGLLSGSGGSLVAGYLDLSNPVGWITSGHGGSAVAGLMTYSNLLSGNLPTHANLFHYTVGTVNTLPNPIVPIYSRLDNPDVANLTVGGSWTSATSWTTSNTGYGPPLAGAPPLGIPVVILPNSRINVNATARSALTTRIDGLLVLGATLQHNFGILTGTGTLRTGTNTFPAGNYAAFVSSAGGTIEYVGPMTMNNRGVYNNLSFIGSGVVTMTNTDLTLNGSWTTANGVTVQNVNNRNMTIARNWTNNGTFQAGTGTVTFNGTASQSIQGSTTFHNLAVNKPSGTVQLAGTGTTMVNNVLSMTNGVVVTSSNNMMSLSSAATISGGSALSFIAGPVRKTMSAGASQTFPVGSLTPLRYRPASINSTSGADTWTIQYFGVNPTTAGYSNLLRNVSTLGTISEFEYWEIARAGTAAAGVTLSYNTDSYHPPVVGEVANLRVGRWTGSLWDLPPGGGVHSQSGTPTTGTVSVTNVTGFGPFTLASTDIFAPLPVTWLDFKAQRIGNVVEVSWQTAQEINNDRFEIERSLNAKSFTKVGQVAGSGNSREPSAYSFTDDNIPAADKYYYRLRQVDFNGNHAYSNVVVVHLNELVNNTDWSAFPNPFRNGEFVAIRFTGFTPDSPMKMSLLDARGMRVLEYSGSLQEVNSYLEQHSDRVRSGIYILTLTRGSSVQGVRIVKQ